MPLLLGSILALIVAAVVGLGATWLTLARGIQFGALHSGAWTAGPRTGTQGIDPYARAAIAQSGELPIGSGDGVTFSANADDSGRRLNGRCNVVVNGTTPQARFWSITLYDSTGGLIANPIDRFGFTSQEIVRNSDGSFEIAISPKARAGNWLPSGDAESYTLVLRLYDTPVGVATRAAREAPLPSITLRSCP